MWEAHESTIRYRECTAHLGSGRYVRDARSKLTNAGAVFDLSERPGARYPFPSTQPIPKPEPPAPRLQTALEGMNAHDPNKDSTPKPETPPKPEKPGTKKKQADTK